MAAWVCLRRHRISARLAGATLVLAIAAAPVRAAGEKDVVVLLNGDRVTGEIKGMDHGRLDYTTDDAGRLKIEWIKIASIRSNRLFKVELGSGQTFYGRLETTADPGTMTVGAEPGELVRMTEVVLVVPMDTPILSRVRAFLDLGLTFAKANSALTISADGGVSYRERRWGVGLEFDAYLQDTEGTTAVGRYTVRPGGFYDFGRWRGLLVVGIEHNDELELALRLSLGAGASYPAVRNAWTELWLTAGLVGDRERYTGGSPGYNLAGYLGATWQVFRYDSPKVDLEVREVLLPLLSDPGRVRGNTDLRIKYEIFPNFNVGLIASFIFDSRPPDPSAPHTDYVLTFTVGWLYNR